MSAGLMKGVSEPNAVGSLADELLLECFEQKKEVAVEDSAKTGAGAYGLIGGGFYSENRNFANGRAIHREQYIAGFVKTKGALLKRELCNFFLCSRNNSVVELT